MCGRLANALKAQKKLDDALEVAELLARELVPLDGRLVPSHVDPEVDHHEVGEVVGFAAGKEVVMIGDFNATPWSPRFKKFLTDSQTNNSTMPHNSK